MPLLINGIDTPPMRLRTLTDVPFTGGTTNVLCSPYTRPAAGAPIVRDGETAQGQQIRRVREAVYHINHRISHHAAANAAFSRTPRGQTLRQLLATTNIYICIDPSNSSVLAASPILTSTATNRTDVRISITLLGFSTTGRSVEATILHELGHICGATHVHSRSGNVGAEHILRASRMGDQFQAGTDVEVP